MLGADFTHLPTRFGPFTLHERIGVGGMAEVFRGAKHDAPGELTAVKILHRHLCENESFVELFTREAGISSMLDHPNIVRCHEMGVVDGRHFLSMEYIDGDDLGAIVEALVRRGEELPVSLAIFVVSAVLAALNHAHTWTDRSGRPFRIVHGDISPSNVLVSRTGRLALLDFGVAQAAHAALAGGGLRGKFAYMSPEQVREKPLDERSDIFSTGVVLYELLTGKRIFEGATDFETLRNVDRAEVPPASRLNPDVPEELDEVLDRAMARDASDRFQTAKAMRVSLSRLQRRGLPRATSAELEELVRRVLTEKRIARKRPRPASDVVIIPVRGDSAGEDADRTDEHEISPSRESTPPALGDADVTDEHVTPPAQGSSAPGPGEADVTDEHEVEGRRREAANAEATIETPDPLAALEALLEADPPDEEEEATDDGEAAREPPALDEPLDDDTDVSATKRRASREPGRLPPGAHGDAKKDGPHAERRKTDGTKGGERGAPPRGRQDVEGTKKKGAHVPLERPDTEPAEESIEVVVELDDESVEEESVEVDREPVEEQSVEIDIDFDDEQEVVETPGSFWKGIEEETEHEVVDLTDVLAAAADLFDGPDEEDDEEARDITVEVVSDDSGEPGDAR